MELSKQYRLVAVNEVLRPAVINLLRKYDLPVNDLEHGKYLFALLSKEDVVGTGGLEFADDCALARSISVKRQFRGQGLGAFIMTELEKICLAKKIARLYLLTTTAAGFFDKAGYQAIDRDRAPDSIKKTSEFSFLCPASAILMMKNL